VRQGVLVELVLRRPFLPAACTSDELADTVDYERLAATIRKIAQRGEYRLLERLGWDLFRAVREFVPPSARLRLTVTKERPPIAGLEGGASFTLGDP
jgi:dihydroneopterin aldolase